MPLFLTYYHVQHGRLFYTVTRRLELGDDTYDIVISRHLSYRRAAVKTGRLNQRLNARRGL